VIHKNTLTRKPLYLRNAAVRENFCTNFCALFVLKKSV